jgi:hypothetical protein
MDNRLERLQLDLVNYRKAVDRTFSSPFTSARDWQQHFLEILICTSQLYLDYLLVTRSLPDLQILSSKDDRSEHIRGNLLREKELRERLKQGLESSPYWIHFEPGNPFSELTGLRRLQDYIDKFALHLPEIYEETFRVEACTKNFLSGHKDSALTQLVVGLQHLGRNHISFVQQALEWAADEDSWRDA